MGLKIAAGALISLVLCMLVGMTILAAMGAGFIPFGPPPPWLWIWTAAAIWLMVLGAVGEFLVRNFFK